MISLLILIFSFCDFQKPDVPYLSEDLFEYELDYSLKKKPNPENQHLDVNGNRTEYNPTPLPYLKVKFAIKTDGDSLSKYTVVDSFGFVKRNRKIKAALTEFVLDIGYTADIKDRITSHSYSINLINGDKVIMNKIDIAFSEEGVMTINGIERGRI